MCTYIHIYKLYTILKSILMMHIVHLIFISGETKNPLLTFSSVILLLRLTLSDVGLTRQQCNFFATISDWYLLKLYESAPRFHPERSGKPRQGLEDLQICNTVLALRKLINISSCGISSIPYFDGFICLLTKKSFKCQCYICMCKEGLFALEYSHNPSNQLMPWLYARGQCFDL